MKTLILALGLTLAASAHAETRKFTMYTVEVNGVKMWQPSTLVVNKGDQIEITATSKVPGANSVHGFTIDGYKIVEVADEKGKQIKFTADKEGIFPFRCQLHAAHLGGELVVLKN